MIDVKVQTLPKDPMRNVSLQISSSGSKREASRQERTSGSGHSLPIPPVLPALDG